MTGEQWHYLPVLQQLVLSLALGLLLGLERQRKGKEIGLRTFAFVSLIGTLSRMISIPANLVALGMVGVIILIMNLQSLSRQQGAEITTSAALFLVALNGTLVAAGQVFLPIAATILIVLLLSFKEELVGFTIHLSKSEVNAAITFGVLAFVILPILPVGPVDPWGFVNLRDVWLIVVLLSAIAFLNYILLRTYGLKGITYTGFLGGFANSTVTITQIAIKARESKGTMNGIALRGIMLANAAMFLRNLIVLGVLAPRVFYLAGLPLFSMILVSVLLAWQAREEEHGTLPEIAVSSPFSLRTALQFGLVFFVLMIISGFAQHIFGSIGFYAVSLAGGMISSSSVTATAAFLVRNGNLSTGTAAVGAVLTSLVSCGVHLPIVWRIGGKIGLGRRLLTFTIIVIVIGILSILGRIWYDHLAFFN